MIVKIEGESLIVTAPEQHFAKKLEQLVKKYPDTCKGLPDRSYSVPISCIRIM